MLLVNKPVGATPLKIIKSLKLKDKVAYAGRLDPMAEGLMILLVGKECKNRDQFQKLDKTYEFEVLFGISSDTYDILGIANLNKNTPPNLDSKIKDYIKNLIGKHKQSYPPYSAIAVNGKKLFEWAKENKLNSIKIPEKEIEVYSIEVLRRRNLTANKLLKYISQRIKKVKGDFRQQEILANWENLLSSQTRKFPVYKFRVKCGSGTYVRGIANLMGEKLGARALALNIKRTQVGPYLLSKYKVTTEVIV